MDTNGNGMLDPDEIQGPMAGMIERLRSVDPSIRTDRPIPMARVREAFERLRQERSGGGDPRGRDRGDDSRGSSEPVKPPPLVPGFDEVSLPDPVPGFGDSAALFAVHVLPEDYKEADERMRRYDRNRDGYLSPEEMTGRWDGDPMSFDQNGDGKLSRYELAVRYAHRRIERESGGRSNNASNDRSGRRDGGTRERGGDDRREGWGRGGERGGEGWGRGGERGGEGWGRGRRDDPPADPYNGRQSYRVAGNSLPEGLPGWFNELDRNGDGQVTMNEYADSWNEERLAEFFSFDLNQDGVITVEEALEGVRNGAVRRSGGSGGSAVASTSRGRGSDSSRSGFPSRGDSSSSGAATRSAPASGATASPSERYRQRAEWMIARGDKNEDGVLTADEWTQMLIDPSPADFDGDGRITVEEYARWLEEAANAPASP